MNEAVLWITSRCDANTKGIVNIVDVCEVDWKWIIFVYILLCKYTGLYNKLEYTILYFGFCRIMIYTDFELFYILDAIFFPSSN